MTLSLVLALGGVAGALAFLLVVVPRSSRYGEALLPAPLRRLRAVGLTAAATLGAGPRLERQLAAAGRRDRTAEDVRRQAVLVSLTSAALSVAAAAFLAAPSWLLPVVALAAAVLGLAAPALDLQHAAAQRRVRLRYELVDVAHHLATMVAAGASIDAALEQIRRYRGELNRELALALRACQAGVAVETALLDFASRVDVPEVTTLVRTLLGMRGRDRTKNGPQLRQMAQDLRDQLQAEARTRRAQVQVRATAFFVLLGLPPIIVAVGYPVLVMVLGST